MAIAFAGPLSRYFAASAEAAPRLRAGVEAWRSALRASVADKVSAQLVWDESADAVANCDLGDSGWLALRLFAFYAERSELELPDTVPPLLELDAAWRAAAGGKFPQSRFGHLLACRVWLPGDFPVTLRAPLPDGDSAEIGSLTLLADQMKWLNQRTFQADAGEIATWLALPAFAGGDLLTAARRGYAALQQAATFALAQRLPLAVRES